ncbi:MAG: DNA polymerase III subunit gamma/tau [Pseudomonadota bacterium]|nr:DNA polymerase III subunit gamma/tau [Pseudomonadota bacterium]
MAEQPAYVAIARKWRPLTLEDMAGQTHVTRTLKNALASGRIHHAFLFTGARGVGKTTAARALARALQCLEGPTASPCGVCGPCVDILAGTCPDVVEIDGASNNSVDDIRDLRDGIRYLPAVARFRVYVIDEVHMLSKGAFNALLKTLEEPPPHVKFIFATTEVNKIPETILSRVQRFDFKRIAASVVVNRLRTICDAEGMAISDAALRMVARAGEGSMRDAQSLLDQVISFGGTDANDAQVAEILGMVDRGVLYEMLTGLVKSEPDRCLDAIASVHESGYEIAQFTGELLELVRNAALVALSPGARKHLDVPEEEKDRLTGLVEGMSAEHLSRTFQTLLEVHDQVARANRPRMVLEMAVARLVAIRPAQNLGPLVERLVELERRLRGSGVTVPPPRTVPLSSTGARGREPSDDPEGER